MGRSVAALHGVCSLLVSEPKKGRPNITLTEVRGMLHQIDGGFRYELRYDVRSEGSLNVGSFLLSFSKSGVVARSGGCLVRRRQGVICLPLWFRNSEPIWRLSLAWSERGYHGMLLSDLVLIALEEQGRVGWDERRFGSDSLVPRCRVGLLQLDDLHFDGRPFYFLFRTGTGQRRRNGTQSWGEIERAWQQLIWWVLCFI